MTSSFAHVLGKGGFGNVYKGKLPDEGVEHVQILSHVKEREPEKSSSTK